MTPVLLGYFPKELAPLPEWMPARGIEEIGSVALCIAGGPDGWDETWTHNAWGFFAAPTDAWACVPRERADRFRLYAYALWPVAYAHGGETPMDVVAPEVAPLGTDFVPVGWDAVSRSGGGSFECSPLSCNLEGRHRRTNRYCLFAEREDAIALARAGDAFEPGPYHVLEVWRREDRGVGERGVG